MYNNRRNPIFSNDTATSRADDDDERYENSVLKTDVHSRDVSAKCSNTDCSTSTLDLTVL